MSSAIAQALHNIRKLAAKRRDAMLVMRSKGISDRQIAKVYGISRERVAQILGRRNAQ